VLRIDCRSFDQNSCIKEQFYYCGLLQVLNAIPRKYLKVIIGTPQGVTGVEKDENMVAIVQILIAALSAAAGPSGICRHAYNTALCALKNPIFTKVFLVIGQWQVSYFKSSFWLDNPKVSFVSVQILNSAIVRNLWYIQGLPKVAKELQVDIVHLSYPIPIRRRLFHCSVIVSLHDLYPYDQPDNFGFPRVIFNRMFLQQCLKEVDVVVCVSEFTLARLKRWVPRTAHRKGLVIHNYVNCRKTNSEHNYLFETKKSLFFLIIAQHRRNKNIVFALKVFSQLLTRAKITPETLLFVVGNQGPETFEIRRFIEKNRLQDSVVFINTISDAKLEEFYRQCELLIAPSTIEGFGFPVAEALCYGCRVVCSDIPSFREVGGDSCYYFDLDIETPELAMAAAIHKAKSGQRTYNFLNRFSIDNASDRYVALCGLLLQQA
jgi:glycosyltransferase involved in cell wall biosynthesis